MAGGVGQREHIFSDKKRKHSKGAVGNNPVLQTGKLLREDLVFLPHEHEVH